MDEGVLLEMVSEGERKTPRPAPDEPFSPPSRDASSFWGMDDVSRSCPGILTLPISLVGTTLLPPFNFEFGVRSYTHFYLPGLTLHGNSLHAGIRTHIKYSHLLFREAPVPWHILDIPGYARRTYCFRGVNCASRPQIEGTSARRSGHVRSRCHSVVRDNHL